MADMWPGLLAIAIIVVLRLLANRTDTLLGRFVRGWWNLSFRLAAYIPFCGWMAHFIIADEAEKEYYIQMGEEVDAWAWKGVEDSANAELARQRRDERIRNKLASDGLTDVSISEDGKYATAKDKRGKSYEVHINYE